MKNFSPTPAWHETPRANELIQEVQSRLISFEEGFWRLLELTRNLEVENTKLRETRQGKKQTAAPKRLRGIAAQSASKS